MSSFVYSTLYAFITFILLRNILKKQKRNQFAGAYTGIMVGSLAFYGITPFLLWTFADYYSSPQRDWKYDRLQKFIFSDSVAYFDVLLAVLLLILGLIAFEYGYNKNRNYSLFAKQKNGKNAGNLVLIKRTALFSFVVGSVAVLLYSSAFGGFLNAFQLSNTLRQHNTSITEYNVSGIYTYILMISGVITISPFLFYYLYKEEKDHKYRILFALSLVFNILYFLLNNGKSAVLRFGIAAMYLVMYDIKIKRKWLIFTLLIVVGLPSLEILDTIFSGEEIALALKEFSFLDAIRDFVTPVQLHYNLNELTDQYGYQYFKYLFLDFLNLLPGLSFKGSHVDTSEFMRGIHWRELGGTPNDLLTYGWIQLRTVGVIVIWYLWGRLAGWMDNMVCVLEKDRERNLFGIIICMNMFSVVACADISATILYNMLFVVTVWLLWLINRGEKANVFKPKKQKI